MHVSFNKHNFDYEYQRIIKELIALGITPTGNKSSDRTRLQIEKSRLANIEEKESVENKNFINTLFEAHNEMTNKNPLQEEWQGANCLADLNRMYFNI